MDTEQKLLISAKISGNKLLKTPIVDDNFEELAYEFTKDACILQEYYKTHNAEKYTQLSNHIYMFMNQFSKLKTLVKFIEGEICH